MTYGLKENESLCRTRHQAFWHNDSLGTPLVFALAEKPGFPPRPWQSPLPRKAWDLSPDWHVNMVENYLYGNCFCGDAMPVASLMVGLDIVNTTILAGGDYDYSSSNDFIGFQPGRFKLEETVAGFDPGHPLVQDLMACYDRVIQRVGQDALVNTPMTLDALSSLYAMCGSSTFLMDMLDKKELIKQRVREMTQTYLAFYDHFYDHLKVKGYGESASWFQVFAEGKFESVRCDFSLMLSPDLFDEFVMPELIQVCDHMDYTLFNMCSVQHARFLDQLATIPSLDGIFWNPEPYLDGIRGYLPVLQKIKEKGMCLEIVCHNVEDGVLAAKTLGPDGLYILFENRFKTPDDAQAAVERVWKACR